MAIAFNCTQWYLQFCLLLLHYSVGIPFRVCHISFGPQGNPIFSTLLHSKVFSHRLCSEDLAEAASLGNRITTK